MIRWEKHGEKWLEAVDRPRSRYQVWRRGRKWAASIAYWATGSMLPPLNISMHDKPSEAMAACLAHQREKLQEAQRG